MFPKLDQAKTPEDFIAAVPWLEARPEANGKVGVVGFCYGGGMVNFLATQVPDLAAGVAFYGSSPNVDDVPRIKAPLLIQSAEVDERINASWPADEAALKAANVRYERHLLSWNAARLQQRHHTAFRCGCRDARLGTDACPPEQAGALSGRRPQDRADADTALLGASAHRGLAAVDARYRDA